MPKNDALRTHAKNPLTSNSQVRRIPWREHFDVRHGFTIESHANDGEDGITQKQVITQVRDGIGDVFGRGTAAWSAVQRQIAALAVS